MRAESLWNPHSQYLSHELEVVLIFVNLQVDSFPSLGRGDGFIPNSLSLFFFLLAVCVLHLQTTFNGGDWASNIFPSVLHKARSSLGCPCSNGWPSVLCAALTVLSDLWKRTWSWGGGWRWWSGRSWGAREVGMIKTHCIYGWNSQRMNLKSHFQYKSQLLPQLH